MNIFNLSSNVGGGFRVLKEKALAKIREYRTRRLVLEAWDKLPRHEFNSEMKTIKAQRLASTFTDSNGDRRDKRFLEEWVAGMPPRFPFGQHHDAALPTIGYIENFRLEEDLEHLGEWFVVGDVSV